MSVKRKREETSSQPPSEDDAPPTEAAPSASDTAASLPAPTPDPAPPTPPSLPRPLLAPLEKDESQPNLSGDGEPEPSPISAGPAKEEPPSIFRWFKQSVGRLPGGMKTEGFKRAARFQCERLNVCPAWLCATVKESGIFIIRTNTKSWLTGVIAVLAGIIHWLFIRNLLERSQHFSHLSTLEKEMYFRSEMGLYYSYFKTIIEAPAFGKGLWMIMHDRLSEYPLVINALIRFNLYPEVVLAIFYRIYTGIMDALSIQTKKCYTVERGERLSPIESCDGLGDPASFYVEMVFVLNGVMMSIFFLYGMYLSGSKLGGLLTVACYFFNHEESTRVMWTPPLRESFSYPFLVVQMFLLTSILRTQNVNRRRLIEMSLFNVFFMLPWQFSQFILLTQVVSIFGIYLLGFIESSKLQKILCAHMVSLAVCFILMLGNTLLLTSYYAAFLVVCWVTLAYPKYLDYLKMGRNNVSLQVIQGFSCLFGTVILMFLMCIIFGVSGDANITSLLKAKLMGYSDLHTAFYTCGAEYDFMKGETAGRYMKTCLLPIVSIVFVAIVRHTYRYLVHSKRETERQVDLCNHGEMVYHAIQLVFFGILAYLIMRLKLFLTPHMCIMASLIFSNHLFGWIFSKVPRAPVAFAILAVMVFQGTANLQKELETVGEFSNLPQEELLLWIKENTKQGAVFAGEMTTMASVKLSALRPIVNHPHYEDEGLRARTKIVYSMYSRKSAVEFKKELMKLGVNYYILEEFWCLRRNRPGCSMSEIWEKEDTHHTENVPLCMQMRTDSGPYFKTVFNNKRFTILQVSKE